MVKIYLDAGHGGEDSGAVGFDLFEKNINLYIIKEIQEVLEKNYEDVEVMLTRSTDVYVSLNERTNKANEWGADVFLSVHVNSATVPSAKGFESHIYNRTNDAKTKAFQNVMHQEIFAQIRGNAIDRGKLASNFHVLRESNMPALLTENLFISNLTDNTQLKQEAFLDKLVMGHVIGLEKFFGLKKVASPTPPTTPKTLYQVVCGTFAELSNAEKLADQLEVDGYKVYIAKKE